MIHSALAYQTVIERTRRWVAAYVLGLNLCPFAEPVVRSNRLAFVVTDAREPLELLGRLEQEALKLVNASPTDCETVLLIHPWVLEDFVQYNDFLDQADALLEELRLDGVLQIASFHPDYCFAGEAPDDPANLSNRSPFPMLHLLREASVSAVIDAGANTDAIVNRNVELLRGLPAQALDDLRQKAGGGDAD